MDPGFNRWPGNAEPASNGQCQAATFTYSASTVSITYSAHSCGASFIYQCQQAVAPCGASPNIAQATKAYSQCSATCCFIGGHVNYTCPSGYQLSGFGGTINCNAGGNYDVDASNGSCDAQPCNNYTLTAANHATANDTSGNYVFGSVVQFTCDNGYGLPGGGTTKTLTCDISGAGVDWDTTVPTCQKVPCPAAANISQSTNDFTGNTSVGITVNYTCNSGYSMADGNSSMVIECQIGGSWSATPVCSATPCDAPPTVGNSNNDYSSNSSVGAIVTYTCVAGYEMADGNSSTSSQCMFGPYWSTPSSCQMIPCGVPVNVSNTVNDFNGNSSVGAVLTYSCAPGYVLPDGNNSYTVECQFGGNWTATQTCQIVTCPELNSSSINLGSVDTYNNTNFNTSVGLSCDAGYMYPTYTLTETVTCTENGTWDKEFTECVPVQCRPVNVANTASVTLSDYYNVSSVVTITCNANHLIPGTSNTVLTANCLNTASWDQSIPSSCTFVQCPALSVVQATASSAVRNYGTSVTLTCNGGWQFNSLSSTTMTVTCQADGTWSPAVPASCDQFTCPAVQNVTFASYNTSSTAYDTVVGYTCDSGYMFSDGTVTRSTRCNELGAWTVTGIPACVAVSCPQLTPIANGVINSTGLTYQSVATYVCDKGFMMPDGSKTGNQTCGMSATWTPALSPIGCQVINCTVPPPVGVFANYSEPLDDNQTSWMYDTKIEYNCTDGYVFSTGDTQRFSRCTAQGDWLPPDIVCASHPIKVEKRTARYPPKEAPGAVVTGSVGVIFVVSVVVSVIASDIGTFKRHTLWAKDNIQSRSAKAEPAGKSDA
ncbi:sushi, von Willebrand factor type A, EGF and pentraxin domain-containing protein 1-like [Lingula anatina]|uniref:Sushi, von Willebrand factor type A, EGF and pentraxin domain-containing protein 1-like n=1 Tax=Lingula anatina TaxID=7574 RepID=A0A1S3GZ83_LINAN|nr:sushi, von Willebrand factor type A, EGF and pentraxin domain-containing protein 1-like [Lingula anatina]|eukprot:XP_013379063.1 sushi, von Willebrand factor type A, EGF and pentraxin domain-containing protein 1-like [Lingula anatina]